MVIEKVIVVPKVNCNSFVIDGKCVFGVVDAVGGLYDLPSLVELVAMSVFGQNHVVVDVQRFAQAFVDHTGSALNHSAK